MTTHHPAHHRPLGVGHDGRIRDRNRRATAFAVVDGRHDGAAAPVPGTTDVWTPVTFPSLRRALSRLGVGGRTKLIAGLGASLYADE